MAQQKTAIIEEARREREKNFTRTAVVKQQTKSQFESSNIRESS